MGRTYKNANGAVDFALVLQKATANYSRSVAQPVSNRGRIAPARFSGIAKGKSCVWRLMPNLDLVFIKTSNTPSGHVEIHIASRSSNYQTRTLETTTAFTIKDQGVWQILPNGDIAFIKTK